MNNKKNISTLLLESERMYPDLPQIEGKYVRYAEGGLDGACAIGRILLVCAEKGLDGMSSLFKYCRQDLTGDSPIVESEVMEYLKEKGYPTPDIHEFTSNLNNHSWLTYLNDQVKLPIPKIAVIFKRYGM